MLERFDSKTCDSMGDPCQSIPFLKNCKGKGLKDCSRKAPVMEQFVKDYLSWEGPYTGARKEHEEERVAERKCYELTATPTPHHLALLEGERNRDFGSEVDPGMKGVVRGRCFRFVLISYSRGLFNC